MVAAPPKLPIDDVMPALLQALSQAQSVVLQAPPGAGKTTRVPLALLRGGGGVDAGGQIVLLEPRRVAARAAAKQLAKNAGATLGGLVGYQVRFENVSSKETKILVVTEGILARRFLRDPTLDGVSCVILDEFHERSIHTDLALAFTRELLEVRDDLKLIVMSATLDAGAVAGYLGNAPVVTSSGRPYPVAIEHVDKRDDRYLDEKMAGAIKTMLKDTDGDVLAFLPGAPEIRRTHERLANSVGDVDVVDLYGSMPPAEQDRALSAASGKRRVILATNVAETSITIDGVTGVVDSGLMKRAAHDPVSDREKLETVRISQASAEQRAGRAGRTRPGRALRLWTLAEHHTLDVSHAPEITRTDLARVLLDVLAFHPGDPRAFPFFERPSPARIERALSLLRLLGAVDDGNTDARHRVAASEGGAGVVRLSPKGRALAELPLHPRTGAVLLAGAFDVEEACFACAFLEDDRVWPREQARHSSDSDVAGMRDTLPRHLRGDVERAARDLAKYAKAGDATLTQALLAGYPDRLCRRRRGADGKPTTDAVMSGGNPGSSHSSSPSGNRGVTLAKESSVTDADLFLALALEGQGASARVRMAHAISLAEIDESGVVEVVTRDEAVFDDEKLIGVRRTFAGDLIVEEKRGIAVSQAAAELALADHIGGDVERYLKVKDDAGVARLAFAMRTMPEGTGNEPWPADAVDVKSALPELVAGKRTVAAVAAADVGAFLIGRLPWPLRRLLDEEAPPRIEVPTGNMITVDYAPANAGGAPVLAVRLQELFGLTETPRVAKGRVAVVLHLLSPGYKPVQVTTDLASFWRSTYAEVKKELRARYPKHSWPDDPLTAPPTARARRRGT